MRDIPECLNRRYKVLDALIKDLSGDHASQCPDQNCSRCKDPCVKLMCDFWSILKDETQDDLSHGVQPRMNAKSSSYFNPQRITCYMANEELNNKKPKPSSEGASRANNDTGGATCRGNNDNVPLSKVLCNLKEAASFDKKCNSRLQDLLKTQKKLKEQIQVLEEREKEGASMLEQADGLWSTMEEAYKKKVEETLDRQKDLLAELKEVEKSASKWRKNKKDLESQLSSIYKCQEDIIQKINQKTNDIKCMDKEIEGFKKRTESNKADTEASKNSLSKKKALSDGKIAAIARTVRNLEAALKDESGRKREKEVEGSQYVKEAREDLQKMCRLLLQKKLENEDLYAEKEALIQEVDMIKGTCDQCKEKCENKMKSAEEQIKEITKEIADFRVQCIQCHECVDTSDIAKFCSDCPKCQLERECIFAGDHCTHDESMDCVCQMVKQKFLDNIFDNMYTVLERQAKTEPGKAVAEAVLDGLRKSKNGKLNDDTRGILKDFILNTVKNNLNLTIVGGAVKTRCEMEPDTYKQLMTCIKDIKTTKPPKVDQGTLPKKESCRRWGGPSECNCPKGPKSCICSKKAPPPPDDPSPCPPKDKDDTAKYVTCPHKTETACGPDCGAREFPSRVAADVSSWQRDPCKTRTCSFQKNMRAAQCVLGSEPLMPRHRPKTNLPSYAEVSVLEDQILCKCGSKSMKPCVCPRDCGNHPRQRMIEEVLGRYVDVSPIERVSLMDDKRSSESNLGRNVTGNLVSSLTPTSSEKIHSRFCTDSTNDILRKDPKQLKAGIAKDLIKDSCFGRYNTTNIEYFETASLKGKGSEKSLTKQEISIKEGKSRESSSKSQSTASTDPLVSYIPEVNKKKDYTITVSSAASKTKGTQSQLKVAIQLERGKWIEDRCTELINTSNGALALVLDEEIVDKIEKKTRDNSNLSVPLQETSSGNYLIDFDELDSDSSASQKIRVKRTKSGSLSLEMDKTLLEALRPGSVLTVPQNKSDMDSWSSVSIEITKRKASSIRKRHKMEFDDRSIRSILEEDFKEIQRKIESIGECKKGKDKVKEMHITISKSKNKITEELKRNALAVINKSFDVNSENQSLMKMSENYSNRTDDSSLNTYTDSSPDYRGSTLENLRRKSIDSYKSEFNNFYLQNKELIIKVHCENGASANVKANVIKTPSENIALLIKDMSSIGDIAMQFMERPALIKRLPTGNYTLYIGRKGFRRAPNTVFKRTSSNEFLVVITEPVIKSMVSDLTIHKPKEELFKVKVKGAVNVVQPPALLRLTSSGNYELVLDKEFEMQHNRTITDTLGKESEEFVELERTNSGTIIINFEVSNRISPHRQNALLVKTKSEDIKILVNGPIFESLSQNIPASSKSSKSKTLEGLLKAISPSGSKTKSKSRLYNIEEIKSSSDSNLYRKSNVRLEQQKNLFAGTSATLTKTESGQYAIVLDKESKKSFANDLKSLLASGSQGRIPIWKGSESGEITIALTGNEGSLKITGSGNIYVLVNENVIKKITNDTNSGTIAADKVIRYITGEYDTRKSSQIQTMTGADSVHIINKLMNPQNAAVCTNCNARPEDSECDASKCVCCDMQCQMSSECRVGCCQCGKATRKMAI